MWFIDFKRVACLDLETALIRQSLQAPPVSVCAIYKPGEGTQLYGTFGLERAVAELLDSNWFIVGHNIAYDMCCLWEWYPKLRLLIKKAYEENRILDTGLCERIVEISCGDLRGMLALDRLCARYGFQMRHKHAFDEDTGEEIKLGFGKHWGTNLEGLSEIEREYCSDDVEDCHKLFTRIWSKQLVSLKDIGKLCRTDFALKTISAFGLRADPQITAKLEKDALEQIARLTTIAINNGFMRLEKGKAVKTKKAYQEAIAAAFGMKCHLGEGRNRNVLYPDEPERYAPMGLVTDTGAVSTGKMVLKESGKQELIMLADLQEWLAVVNKDLKIFNAGVFHSRFGYANTLRTTSSKPNIQNFRKKAGVRECITPYWGAFVASDYTGLENGTLAQCIVNYTGRRGMAEKISKGHDFHIEVGAIIAKMSYGEFEKALADEKKRNKSLPEHERVWHYKKMRAAAKPANFGLPGNMRKPSTFQSYALVGYDVRMTLEEAENLMNIWWTNMHDQMAYLEAIEDFKIGPNWDDLYDVPIPGTDIIRRNCTSCAAANTGFQGLGMQTSADALWLIVMAQLLGTMPGRACAFVHDEVISDCKPLDIDQVEYYHSKYMIQAAEMNLPDVTMAVESTAMDRWSKDAASVHENGHLILQHIAA